uniref:Putative Transcriptional regulator, MucR family n=1 Tax=Magnetococcus massalia (strain MO-1) TaxID=451514 RepID=A0A1S7LL26_MAGMO|nr:putative Transcriptional regulator, MucR family [Candidatus Magnetococcus massalia]
MSVDLIQTTAGIVESYVSNNELNAKELPALINEVFASLEELSEHPEEGMMEGDQEALNSLDQWTESLQRRAAGKTATPQAKPTPAVAVDQAVTEDGVTCLICGKTCKALKGHLTRTHKMNVSDYREMFDLPRDFPMVAPNYSEKRRQLAQDAGLGEKLYASRQRKRNQAQEQD